VAGEEVQEKVLAWRTGGTVVSCLLVGKGEGG
jgi:hypothetical protein